MTDVPSVVQRRTLGIHRWLAALSGRRGLTMGRVVGAGVDGETWIVEGCRMNAVDCIAACVMAACCRCCCYCDVHVHEDCCCCPMPLSRPSAADADSWRATTRARWMAVHHSRPLSSSCCCSSAAGQLHLPCSCVLSTSLMAVLSMVCRMDHLRAAAAPRQRGCTAQLLSCCISDAGLSFLGDMPLAEYA